MFQITVNTRRAIVGEKELITTRSAGIQVQFTFSEDWDGLAKFAIFRNGEDDESRVAMAVPTSGLVELPAENCAVDYIDEPIFAGVYGNNGLGTTIIPTIWASMGVLREGASYEGAMPADPTPDMWAQILAIANEAHDIAEDCAEAEQLRAAAEELRVAAETARAAAENGRVSAEEARVTAENLRATAEDLRVTAENARSAAEQNRATAEAARASAEASRQQNESTRQSNETARQTAESNRASAESTRASNEQARRQAEAARADAEGARADAETARVLAESARVAAEQARVNAENARGTAEDARASAEALRASAESARASAEAARATAESNRADTFADWTTTFNGWQSTLDGKADQSDLDALSTDVTELNRQISESITPAIEEIETALDGKAPVIVNTASGAIASFADGANDIPIKSLIVNIEPVQAGTGDPSPDNIRPISGHTGLSVEVKGGNLLDKTGAVRGGFDANGNVLENAGESRYVTAFLSVKPNTTYYIDQTIPLIQGRAGFWYDANQTAISQISFNGAGVSSGAVSSPENAKYCRLGYLAKNENVCSMSVGSSAPTAYEPYKGNQIYITFPSSAGTVYGGTLDVSNGVLTVDKLYKKGGFVRERLDSSGKCWLCGPLAGSYRYEAWEASDAITNYFTVSSLEVIRQQNSGAALFSGSLWIAGYANNTEALDALFQTLEVVYKINVPITYQLTAQQLDTLLGTNNIWTDVGTVDVEYPADTKLYIDGKIAAAIANALNA